MSDAVIIRSLRKVYGTAPVAALDALDLTVAEGEFFGMLGPNGAGKTTTIGILTTRVRATAGDALVGGASVSREPAFAIALASFRNGRIPIED